MTERENASAVGEAIRIAAEELRPWMTSRIGPWPPNKGGDVAPYDPSYLIGVLLDRWHSDFQEVLGAEGLTLVQDLRHTRNRWAHHVPFDDLDALRGVDTCRRLLKAIKSERVGELEGAVLRLASGLGSEVAVAPRTSPASEHEPTPSKPPRLRSGDHRRMRLPAFREEQWQHRFDPHVAPLNSLVDDLIEEKSNSWMPYIPPYHGGIDTEIVLLYQDPGKMTNTAHGGSGFLGCENDDPTAQLLAECLDAAGLSSKRVTPWNAYPWFLQTQGTVTAGMLTEGLDPLRRVLELMPRVHALVTGGAVAHRSWRLLTTRYPEVARRVRHLETFHTSGLGITNGGQQKKAVGVAEVVKTFRLAATPRGLA